MESVIATREEVHRFLSAPPLIIGSDVGYGYGSGYGTGYGFGSGYGFGTVEGHGYGTGFGIGYGSEEGDGYGADESDVYGSCRGSGYSPGSGSSDGTGYGSIYGYNDIKTFNGNIVDCIDNIPTIITQVRGNIARGYIIKDDLTLFPCYVVRVGNSFAHGETIKDAVVDAEAKEMEEIPIEERIEKFMEIFGSLDSEYIGKKFYDWHHILTGSCRMGRDEFCKAHDIDLKKKYTVRYFLDITKNSYGSDIIKQIYESYELMEECNEKK